MFGHVSAVVYSWSSKFGHKRSHEVNDDSVLISRIDYQESYFLIELLSLGLF